MLTGKLKSNKAFNFSLITLLKIFLFCELFVLIESALYLAVKLFLKNDLYFKINTYNEVA